jgi:hypothetical protein
VGTGQVASWAASVNAQFDLLLTKARADGDAATVRQFEAIGRPDPKDTHQYFAFSGGLLAAEAPSDRAWIKAIRAAVPASLATDPKNFRDFLDGFGFSAQRILPEQRPRWLISTG